MGYNYEKRKEILEIWAEEKGCEWLNDEKLKMLIFESLIDEKILPTPLNIHDFVIASSKIKNEKELKQELNKYSKEGEKAFADEIIGLYYSGRKDRVLFLSFIFLSQNFDVDFIKKQYEDMNYENCEYLEKILNEEQRVKTEIRYPLRREPQVSQRKVKFRLAFSHPSYFKALPYILEDPGCRKIFCDVLKRLSDIRGVARYVVRAIRENFDKLPGSLINELLLKLANREEVTKDLIYAKELIYTIIINFDKLPEKVQNLLFKLSDIDKAAKYIVRAIKENFDKLPETARDELLLKLADKKEVTEGLANLIAIKFDRLPISVQSILFKFANKRYAVWDVAWAIVINFNKLPKNVQNLLFELADREYAAGAVMWAVAINFYELQENVQNLLYKTSIQR